jgi:hypothetical protein
MHRKTHPCHIGADASRLLAIAGGCNYGVRDDEACPKTTLDCSPVACGFKLNHYHEYSASYDPGRCTD